MRLLLRDVNLQTLQILFLLANFASIATAARQENQQDHRPEDLAPKAANRAEIIDTATFSVRVGDKSPLIIDARVFEHMPHQSVTVQDHGTRVEYSGVLVREVLAQAGAPFGKELRGKSLSSYVLATARDGYAVVYTLTEMDPDFSDGDLLIADKRDGKPLGQDQGPFRVVVPHDKKPARSLRMLDRIEVIQLRK